MAAETVDSVDQVETLEAGNTLKPKRERKPRNEKPTGEIEVKNMWGFTTTKIKLDEKNVIPGAVRKIESQLKKQLLFGTYTATLTLHNGTVQTLTAKSAFTVIPYKLLAIVAIIVFLLVLFYRKSRKRLRRAMRILAGKE